MTQETQILLLDSSRGQPGPTLAELVNDMTALRNLVSDAQDELFIRAMGRVACGLLDAHMALRVNEYESMVPQMAPGLRPYGDSPLAMATVIAKSRLNRKGDGLFDLECRIRLDRVERDGDNDTPPGADVVLAVMATQALYHKTIVNHFVGRIDEASTVPPYDLKDTVEIVMADRIAGLVQFEAEKVVELCPKHEERVAEFSMARVMQQRFDELMRRQKPTQENVSQAQAQAVAFLSSPTGAGEFAAAKKRNALALPLFYSKEHMVRPINKIRPTIVKPGQPN